MQTNRIVRIGRQAGRKADRQIWQAGKFDRQAGRQTDRQKELAGRQANRQAGRKKELTERKN